MAPKTKATETEETTEETTEKVIRPSDLAKELEVSPKNLRSFLRREVPRPADSKNTSWNLTEEMIEKATAHFTETESDEDEDEENDDEA